MVIVIKYRAHLLVGCDSRHINTIGWSMYHIHISTIIIRVGSSIVLAIGLGSQAYWREVLSTGIVPQAYRYNSY